MIKQYLLITFNSNVIMKKTLLIIVLLTSVQAFGQFLNRDVKAIVEVVKSEKMFEITPKAENISKISQSLLFELKVFKKDTRTGNVIENKQTGRFVISPGDIKKLSFTAIDENKNNEEIIVLLLLRNLDNDIIGKDRKVISGNSIKDSDDENKIVLKRKPKDGIRLTGVVLERVKTKPGRDFYNFFYSQFLSYNFTDSRAVMVEEVFSRGRTTQIHIKVDNVKVYEFFVQPKIDFLKQNATIAIKIIYNYFSKKEKDYIVRY